MGEFKYYFVCIARLVQCDKVRITMIFISLNYFLLDIWQVAQVTQLFGFGMSTQKHLILLVKVNLKGNVVFFIRMLIQITVRL